MATIHLELNQTKRYLGKDKKVLMPYITNFSFAEEYPYSVRIIGVNQLRFDHMVRKITGTQYGWKMLCIFNDVLSPIELISKYSLIIPEDYGLAINWLRQKNVKI